MKLVERSTALRSTPEDMLRFLSAQAYPEKSPLKAAIRLTHSTQYMSKDAHEGLGWEIFEEKGHRALWHNVATGSHRAFMAVIPDAHAAVFLLSNTDDASEDDESLDEIGFELLKSRSDPFLSRSGFQSWFQSSVDVDVLSPAI